jgi:hypothetical protein
MRISYAAYDRGFVITELCFTKGGVLRRGSGRDRSGEVYRFTGHEQFLDIPRYTFPINGES